ncbi:MAG: sialidase [Candidatus Aminicenantes bacterium]|nr:sialidase [Candidatus Aminicenantes bacterium]
MSSKSRRIVRVCLVVLALGLIFGPGSAQRPGGQGGGPPEGLRFRFMGPAVGNRISAAAGIPGDPSTYYVGAASGGVWKSVNGGTSWVPISDDLPVGAIGSLAVAAANPDIVWAGTGDAWPIRDSDLMGDGIYKSVDAGKTWTHMGLTETGRIGRIIIHPTNPNIVYAAALGRLTGPQEERGVYRTTDGGKTWSRILFVDPNTGCSGLAMDPNNPQVLFAGMWQAEMHTWAMFSGGPGSGVYMSRDGGATWKRLEGHGLPKPPVGKIDIAIAARNSKRVYALIQTADQGSIWRSDDGGENWRVMSWQRALIGRAGFYIRLAISPSNPDEVLVANSSFHQSLDGGKSFRTLPWGGDTHDIWIDPKNADRILVTHDGGMFMTTDHGKTSNRVTLPIGQMYHVAVDNDVPYRVYSNMQDNGTMRGLSTTPEAGPNVPASGTGGGGFGGGRAGAGGVWDHGLGGCESGFTIPDPTDANIIWSSCYGFALTRYDFRTKLARSVSPVQHTLDSEPNKLKYRAHWTPPIAIDPFDHNTVYFGAQVIFRTTNAGQSWSVISPDLSTQDPRFVVSSGGIVGDNLGQFYGEVVFSIAPSPVRKGLIWAGTNDGKVWLTRDGGRKWTDVTQNIKGVPAWGTVSKIDPSAFDPTTAYIAIDLHLMDNRDPWLFKTADFGVTWTKITGDLPQGHPLDYARVITENPNRKGMLFVGTGRALYYSMDDGRTWKRLKEGLPPAAVSWVVVQKQAHDLVVSTYGRGIYIMEDITPLEQGMMEGAAAAGPKLTAPRPAYRLVRGGRAILNYTLPAAPKDPVQVEILDANGTAIRKLPSGQGRAGLNRISWDLRHEPPRLVALRTTPTRNPHIWEEPRFQNATTRPITHWGIAQAQVGPVAAPGAYTIRLTVAGQAFMQPLTVLLPPNNTGTEADIRASVKLQLRVRDNINLVSDMTNQIEWLRRQLEDARKPLAARPVQEALIKGIDDFDAKMLAVEDRLISRSEALSDDKYYQEAYKLYLNFIWLNGEIGTGAGDVAGSADYGPTDTAVGLVADLEKELQAAQTAYRDLIDKEVPAFNRSVEGKSIPALKMTGAPAPSVPPVPGR